MQGWFNRSPPWVREILDGQRRIEEWCEKLSVLLSIAQRVEGSMQMTISDLQAKVTTQTTVVGSVVTLITGISQQLKDAIAANNPAAIQAVADALDANTAALSGAVPQNTPAA